MVTVVVAKTVLVVPKLQPCLIRVDVERRQGEQALADSIFEMVDHMGDEEDEGSGEAADAG